jgi:hypothetical protein
MRQSVNPDGSGWSKAFKESHSVAIYTTNLERLIRALGWQGGTIPMSHMIFGSRTQKTLNADAEQMGALNGSLRPDLN